MTFAGDLVSRLEQQRSRIQSMLSPGRRNQSGGANAPLSPVASDFAGKKFQIAAKRMRVLSSEKTEPFYARTLSPLIGSIPQKYQSVKDVIHVRPFSGRNASMWSEMETIFPGMRAQTEREIAPSTGGVLRQGSIIQKFKTVPDPGQSIESFRKQVEFQPRPSRTPAQQKAKQPGLSPRDRLYSRVQEIKPGEKPDIAETTGRQETAPQISSAQNPTVDAVVKKPASQQSIQRKIDAPISKQESPTIERQPDLSLKTNELLPKTEENMQPVEKNVPRTRSTQEIRAEERVKLFEQEDQTSIVDQPEVKVLATERPAATKKAIAKPVDKQEIPQRTKADAPLLLKALPIREEKPAKPALKKAIPVKTAKRSDDVLSIRAPQPKVSRQSVSTSTSSFVQRTPAKPESKPAQIPGKPQAGKNESPVEQLELPRDVDSSLPEKEDFSVEVRADVQPDVQPVVQPVENPLLSLGQMVKANQKKAMNLVHRHEPTMTLPTSPKPLIMQAFTKPLPRQKSQSAEKMPHYAGGLFPSSGNFPKVFPGGTQKLTSTAPQIAGGPQKLSLSQADVNEVEMEMPIASQQPGSQAPELPGKPSVSQNKASAIQGPQPTRAASPTNVIQRLWEEHTGGPSQGGDTGGSAESSSQGDPIGGVDLEILAEEVFPYVKRIIEIEANRSFKI